MGISILSNTASGNTPSILAYAILLLNQVLKIYVTNIKSIRYRMSTIFRQYLMVRNTKREHSRTFRK